MPVELTTTVTLLSAGASPYLIRIIEEILGGTSLPTRLEVIWSGDPGALPPLPPAVVLVKIPPEQFDHGGTRQLALNRCSTAVQVLLSDDAEPSSDGWLRALCEPFRDPRVAAVYGRQLPRDDAPLFERALRASKYPGEPQDLGPNDLKRIAAGLGPVSNANAAYRVDALRAAGGFERATYAEDVAAAVRMLRAGWRLWYASQATVLHSHHSSNGRMFGRGWQAGRAGTSTTVWRSAAVVRSAFRFIGGMLGAGWREGGIRGLVKVAQGIGARSVGFALARWTARPSGASVGRAARGDGLRRADRA